MIVMQNFGRCLVLEPYFETVVLAGGLIEDVAFPEQRQEFLPKIMEGRRYGRWPGRKDSQL